MKAVSPSMNATTPAIDMQTDVCETSSSVQAKSSACEPEQPTLFSFGDDSLTTADRRELIALFSETKAQSNPRSLCDRLTPSLISSGLIAGITPTSIRERFGAPIPDFALLLPDGGAVEQRNQGCSYLSASAFKRARASLAPEKVEGES